VCSGEWRRIIDTATRVFNVFEIIISVTKNAFFDNRYSPTNGRKMKQNKQEN